jgi:hypothetical protein
MSKNQKIFYKALNAGCKTAKDLALYLKSNSTNSAVKFLETSDTKSIKRYFNNSQIAIS